MLKSEKFKFFLNLQIIKSQHQYNKYQIVYKVIILFGLLLYFEFKGERECKKEFILIIMPRQWSIQK